MYSAVRNWKVSISVSVVTAGFQRFLGIFFVIATSPLSSNHIALYFLFLPVEAPKQCLRKELQFSES